MSTCRAKHLRSRYLGFDSEILTQANPTERVTTRGNTNASGKLTSKIKEDEFKIRAFKGIKTMTTKLGIHNRFLRAQLDT